VSPKTNPPSREGVDVYRLDCNMDPVLYWRGHDAPDRQGITELPYVEGYLAHYDLRGLVPKARYVLTDVDSRERSCWHSFTVWQTVLARVERSFPSGAATPSPRG
jgi:hypothetical protein